MNILVKMRESVCGIKQLLMIKKILLIKRIHASRLSGDLRQDFVSPKTSRILQCLLPTMKQLLKQLVEIDGIY